MPKWEIARSNVLRRESSEKVGRAGMTATFLFVYLRINSSGSFAIFAAICRASSRLPSLKHKSYQPI
jgi:hypothetical protein